MSSGFMPKQQQQQQNNLQNENKCQEPDKLVCFGKIAEQAERYNDQIEYMVKFLETCDFIKLQDLNLYANGYKCKINSVRTAWRAICTIQQKQTNSKSRFSAILQFYKQKLEKEIRQICQQVICMVISLFNRKAQQKVRFLCYKMKGDYHRYLCEIARDEELKKFQKQCQNAYLKGLNAIKESEIRQSMKTDALKMGISLNLSVFYYQIMNLDSKAIQVSQKSFQQCLQAINDIEDTRFTDVVTIMQLIHDNIVQWTSESEVSVKH